MIRTIRLQQLVLPIAVALVIAPVFLGGVSGDGPCEQIAPCPAAQSAAGSAYDVAADNSPVFAWTNLNMGAGSGLDADRLDGRSSEDFDAAVAALKARLAGQTQQVTNAAKLTFTGLNGETDGGFEIIGMGRIVVLGGSPNDRFIVARPNGDAGPYTNTRFYSSYARGGDPFSGPVASTDAGLALGSTGWAADSDIVFRATVSARVGTMRLVESHDAISPTGLSDRVSQRTFGGVWRNAEAPITSLDIVVTEGLFTGTITVRPIAP